MAINFKKAPPPAGQAVVAAVETPVEEVVVEKVIPLVAKVAEPVVAATPKAAVTKIPKQKVAVAEKDLALPEEGKQLTIKDFDELFNRHMNKKSDTPLTKAYTSAICKSVFEFLTEEVLPNWSVSMGPGLLFKREVINGKVYPNPKVPGENILVNNKIVAKLSYTVNEGERVKGTIDANKKFIAAK